MFENLLYCQSKRILDKRNGKSPSLGEMERGPQLWRNEEEMEKAFSDLDSDGEKETKMQGKGMKKKARE